MSQGSNHPEQEILNAVANPVETSGSAQKSTMQQLIVFRLGGEEYGLAIDQVKEIVAMPNVARVPLTPSYVKGVANVRGNILSIIDLAEKFGLVQQQEADPAVEAKPGYLLVMESALLKMGIQVREVPSTLSVSADQIDQSLAIVQDNQTEGSYIKGIVRASNRLIILIDIYKLINKDVLSTVGNPIL